MVVNLKEMTKTNPGMFVSNAKKNNYFFLEVFFLFVDLFVDFSSRRRKLSVHVTQSVLRLTLSEIILHGAF